MSETTPNPELPKHVWERRTALRHWLEIQARAAVDYAESWPDGTVVDEVKHLTEMADRPCSTIDPLAALRNAHRLAISDAAKFLEKAELLHREIVRRGGKI